MTGAEESWTWAVVFVIITGTWRKSLGYGQYVEADKSCQGAYIGIAKTNAGADGRMKLLGEALTGNLLARN